MFERRKFWAHIQATSREHNAALAIQQLERLVACMAADVSPDCEELEALDEDDVPEEPDPEEDCPLPDFPLEAADDDDDSPPDAVADDDAPSAAPDVADAPDADTAEADDAAEAADAADSTASEADAPAAVCPPALLPAVLAGAEAAAPVAGGEPSSEELLPETPPWLVSDADGGFALVTLGSVTTCDVAAPGGVVAGVGRTVKKLEVDFASTQPRS